MTVGMTVPQYERRQCVIVRRMSPKEAELLALLLVSHPDKRLELETVIETLWPDPWAQPDGASSYVSDCISHLRSLGIEIEGCKALGWRIPREARLQVAA